MAISKRVRSHRYPVDSKQGPLTVAQLRRAQEVPVIGERHQTLIEQGI
jgi:hypothetical protein